MFRSYKTSHEILRPPKFSNAKTRVCVACSRMQRLILEQLVQVFGQRNIVVSEVSCGILGQKLRNMACLFLHAILWGKYHPCTASKKEQPIPSTEHLGLKQDAGATID